MQDLMSLSDTQIAAIVFFAALVFLLALARTKRKSRAPNAYPRAYTHAPPRREYRHGPAPSSPMPPGEFARAPASAPEPAPAPPRPRADTSDAALQLNAVMAGAYEKRRILNYSEYCVFRVIDEEIAAAQKGFRVFAQTCLGEILASPDEAAFRAINAKRVDMLIVDKGGWPVLAVEYQGPGHYQGNAAARDAIKKEALRKAGVRTVEITEGDSDQQIRARVREHLGWPMPAAVATPRPKLVAST
jgi:hypothetical protein